ncbi:MAG: hypothetical protein O2840_05170, partial [bacterium]|nr:hypothetical protein [bacterium]
ASELRYQLKKRKKLLSGFTKGLEFVLQNCDFYLLYVVVEKKMAQKRGWDSVYIYKQTYLLLLSNLLKFLTAKKRNGQIFSEASNISQDTHLYNAFFHLIRRGIADSLITNVQARQRFTSLCFVTKPNNDAEEQLADFFGIYGRLKMEIEEKIRSPSKLDDFEVLISKIANKSLFRVTNAQAARKVRLYKEIDSFKIIP